MKLTEQDWIGRFILLWLNDRAISDDFLKKRIWSYIFFLLLLYGTVPNPQRLFLIRIRSRKNAGTSVAAPWHFGTVPVRIRIRMRIREAQKLTNSDPDAVPGDPEHRYIYIILLRLRVIKEVTKHYKSRFFLTIYAWWWKDTYLWLTDPGADPGSPKKYGSFGSGSATLSETDRLRIQLRITAHYVCLIFLLSSFARPNRKWIYVPNQRLSCVMCQCWFVKCSKRYDLFCSKQLINSSFTLPDTSRTSSGIDSTTAGR